MAPRKAVLTMFTIPKRARRAAGILAIGVLTAFSGALGLTHAADPAEDPEYGSTFGRVRFLEGSMTLQRTADRESTDANVNDPVAAGDRLLNGDGRSEIGLADGSTLWLDVGTRLSVRNLADIDSRYESTNLFALETGAVRILAPDPENRNKTFRVDTEGGSVYLLSGGSFRIETDEGITTVYSFRGVAELSGDDGSVLVRSGERSSVEPGRAPSEAIRFNTARLDDFDRFCESRLGAYAGRGSDEPIDTIVQEVPREVHPYVGELSYYGSWQNVPDYGWVWRPVYSGAWGPYVNGYWSWCRTGWVWVSYDPWGWAPYHYGRWDMVVNVGWVWIPGRVWSGAWVSFAAGPSYVGWCPLNYYNRPVFQDTAIVNVVNVNVSRLQPRGWRYVSIDQFGERRAPRGAVRVDRLPRGTDVVITSRLPQFDPHDVGRQPGHGAQFVDSVRRSRAPLPAAVDRDNKPMSFRTSERVSAEARGRRGAPAALEQLRPRPRQTRPGVRPGSPDGQVRGGPPRTNGRPAGRSDSVTREKPYRPQAGRRYDPAAPNGARGRGVNAPPQGTVPPARQRTPGGERIAPPTRQPESSREPQGRAETRPQGRGNDAPRSEPPRDKVRRPGAASDEPVGRLFDGVRSERGRPRAEAPRATQPGAQRPEVKPRQRERPPQPQPQSQGSPSKPKDDHDKGDDKRH
ncbi:MAG TPA: DUF6600 domain-containing protein [Candidatus Polarisedimenticolia bacterium]|nr:DUF6600 domain-containing protein [Candidatus Polarisedimenticolia bacterium]